MLSNKEIQKAVDNNEIEIFYSFKKDLTFISEEVKFNDSEYKSNLYADGLKLTLGPIIKNHQKRFFNSKINFKGFSNCIDIRGNDNKYKLKPKESITILTNERIALNGNYSALIIPKVSLSEIGIVVSPAYIEPYYNGILRLLVNNNSDVSYDLKALEGIAQCYFFKFSESVSDEIKSSAPSHSSFYGHKWNSIIEEDKEPFPTRKVPNNKPSTGENIKIVVKDIWYFLNKNALTTVIITLLFTFLLSIGIIKQQFINKFNDIETNKIAIENLKKDFKESFKSNKSEIILNKGEEIGLKEILVPIPKKNIISVLCSNDLISWTIISENMNESKIQFSYKNEKNEDNIIEFEYTIIRGLQ